MQDHSDLLAGIQPVNQPRKQSTEQGGFDPSSVRRRERQEALSRGFEAKAQHGYSVPLNRVKQPSEHLSYQEHQERSDIVRKGIDLLGKEHPAVRGLLPLVKFDDAYVKYQTLEKPVKAQGLPSYDNPNEMFTVDGKRKSAVDVMRDAGLDHSTALTHFSNGGVLAKLMPYVRSAVESAHGSSKANVHTAISAVLQACVDEVNSWKSAVDAASKHDDAMYKYEGAQSNLRAVLDRSYTACKRVTEDDIIKLQDAVDLAELRNSVRTTANKPAKPEKK